MVIEWQEVAGIVVVVGGLGSVMWWLAKPGRDLAKYKLDVTERMGEMATRDELKEALRDLKKEFKEEFQTGFKVGFAEIKELMRDKDQLREARRSD